MTDIEERLDSFEEKLDQIIDLLGKFGNSSSTKTSKPKGGKKAVVNKVDQFKISTQDLLDSSEPLCAYMQRSEDCEGHCGRPASYTVIRDHPESLEDLDLEDPKDERAELLRKSFLRCNGCKSKAQKAEISRAYKTIKRIIYKQTGEDTAVAADLEAMMGSPRKGKKGKAPAKGKKGKDNDEPDVSEGLDNPEDTNKHLLKNNKWFDKFVKVAKKNMIVRSYKGGNKKDVCIGLIDDEPEDDQYVETLRKPGKAFLDKVGLKYMSPEDAAKGTPPKANKKDSDDEEDNPKKGKSKTPVKEESDKSKANEDDSDDDDSSKPPSKGKKGKAPTKDKDESDDDDDSPKPPSKGKKGKAPTKDKDESDDDDDSPKPADKGKKGKASSNGKSNSKNTKKDKKDDSDDDDDGEEGEAEAFRDMADSD